MLPLQHERLWRVLSVCILVVVLIGTMIPSIWIDSKVQALLWFENTDKWIHGITFHILSVWFTGLTARSAYLKVIVGLTLFGFVVELCQLFISYRTADWIDIAANTIGIIAGIAVALTGLGGWGLRVESWYSRRSGH